MRQAEKLVAKEKLIQMFARYRQAEIVKNAGGKFHPLPHILEDILDYILSIKTSPQNDLIIYNQCLKYIHVNLDLFNANMPRDKKACKVYETDVIEKVEMTTRMAVDSFVEIIDKYL